jgi:glycosyltransferase involved in cell wall biosynthesis
MRRKKRILILTRLNPKKFGSFEEFLLILSEALIEKGCEVFLTFSSPPQGIIESKLSASGINTVVFDFKCWSKARTTLAMAFFLLKIKPEVIVTSFISLYHPILFLAKIFTNPRLIYVFHSINTSDWKPHIPAGFLRTIRKATVPVSLWLTKRSVDLFISVSNFVRGEAIKLYGIPKEKARVIHNGVNLDRFKGCGVDRANLRNTLGIDFKEGELIITSVANLIEAKGLQILLQSFRLLTQIHENTRLMIVGEGPFMNNLRLLVEEMKLDGKVIFTGIRNDIDKILAVSDVVVVPSLCDEAFAYTVVEAMASGRPVVGSNVGGIPEQIKEGVTGLLFPPGDFEGLLEKLRFLIENKEKRTELGKLAAESTVENFSVNDQVSRYFEAMGIR